jgi:hypothetical protein
MRTVLEEDLAHAGLRPTDVDLDAALRRAREAPAKPHVIGLVIVRRLGTAWLAGARATFWPDVDVDDLGVDPDVDDLEGDE